MYDDLHRLVDLVENDHAIVEGERQVGQLAIVFRSIRQVLGVAHDVVARVSNGAAAESRQAGKVHRAVLLQQFLEFIERIVGLEAFFVFSSPDDDVVSGQITVGGHGCCGTRNLDPLRSIDDANRICNRSGGPSRRTRPLRDVLA